MSNKDWVFKILLSTMILIKEISGADLQFTYEKVCDHVCYDLPKYDNEPVCMMSSRYKKGYQFFMNMCHARRAICKENLSLHQVHPYRCEKSRQFFMVIN